MFLTLLLTVEELNVTEAVAFNHYCEFTILNNQPSFLKAVRNRLHSFIRVIVKRVNDDNEFEYHCVDFTGRSFVVIDKSNVVYTPSQLSALITVFVSEYRLTTTATPQALDFASTGPVNPLLSEEQMVRHAVTFPTSPQRPLNEHEQYFHEFARAMAAEYFIGE